MLNIIIINLTVLFSHYYKHWKIIERNLGKNGGPLMTDSVIATILEGEGYHTFRGPRPIAWDQIFLMLTGNVAKYVHTLAAVYY